MSPSTPPDRARPAAAAAAAAAATLEVPDADRAHTPAARLTGREWRTALELAAASRALATVTWPRGDGQPVMVLPGFLAGPESTVFLRSHLKRLGYRVHDWGLGRNLGLRPNTEDELEERLAALHDRYGRTVSLIGWSAGGIYAREMARQRPEWVRQVITLGSPFRGHPRATRAWRFYRFMNRGDHTRDLMSAENLALRAQPLDVPTTCVFSRRDGIVAWECCTSLPAPTTENIEVDATHLGYGHHLPTLEVIADRLALPEGQWRPWSGTGAGGIPDPTPTGPQRGGA